MRRLLQSSSALLFLASAMAAADTSFWIAPCEDPRTGCKPGDLDLARWALESWQKAANGLLHFVEAKDREHALIRLIWASPQGGLYGETQPIVVDGRRGAQIFVVNTTSNVTDPLLRDTIVYLTCLHESGHALGLRHTDQFADIMYSFQYGGDISEYFGRYRRNLTKKEDIRKNSGLSLADVVQLKSGLTAFERQ